MSINSCALQDLTTDEFVVGHVIADADLQHTQQPVVRTITRESSADLRHLDTTTRLITRENTADLRHTQQPVVRTITRESSADLRHTQQQVVRSIARENAADLRHLASVARTITRENSADLQHSQQPVARTITRVNAADLRHLTDYQAIQRRADFDGYAQDVALLTACISRWVDEEHAPFMLQIFNRILENIQSGGTAP